MKKQLLGSLLLCCGFLCATPHNKKKIALNLQRALQNNGVLDTSVPTMRPQVSLKYSYENRFARLRNAFVSGDTDVIQDFYEQGFLCTEQEIFYVLNYPTSYDESLKLGDIYMLIHRYQPDLLHRVLVKKDSECYPRSLLIYTMPNGNRIKAYTWDELLAKMNE